MITRDPQAFLALARGVAPDFGPATARGAFMVAPDGFARAQQSAQDNVYMSDAASYDAQRASAQHRQLQRALASELPVACLAGDPDTPDALFPNNVFASARVNGQARCIVARMRHPVRQREAGREDIRGFFRLLGHDIVDLSVQPHACELTGSLVIDRARGIGFCGLSERCDAEGARLMHAAFGLRATLVFDLAPGEYHANVVLAVLAGRAALVCPRGFADAEVPEAIAALYAPHGIVLSTREHAAFAANAISLAPDSVWMSQAAAASLAGATRQRLQAAGFALRSVPLEAIEVAGGSLRCCVGELF